MRLLRVIVILLILAIGGLTGYAYLGDMGAAPKEMRVPVELDLGAAVIPVETPDAATPDQPEATSETGQADSAQPDADNLD